MAKQKSAQKTNISATEQIALGKKLQQQNKPRQAEKCWRKAIAKNPRLWGAYQCLGELLSQEKKSQAAIKLYRQGIKANPQHPRYHFALARTLMEQQKWQEANTAYQKALKLQTNAVWGNLNWAKVLVELDRWQEAETATQKAIALKPDLWEAYHHLGKIYQHRHQWQSAVTAYQKVIELKPDFMHGYLRLAEVYCQLDREEEAIACYARVIETAPENSLVQDRAISSYQKTLATNPNTTAEQYYELGKLCRGRGCFWQAILAYQQAIKLKPKWQLPYISIQYTPIDPEKLPKLVNFYSQIVSENPKLPLAWGNLGDVLAQQNNLQKAIICYRTSCYQRVTSLYPKLANLDWKNPKQNAPDFLIAGASKCGTSALYSYLSHHPQLLLSHKKELDFFGQNFDRGVAWYLAHFPSITDREDFFTGEATPNYLRFPVVAKRIKEIFPDLKIIILLRNPTDRAISWHYHKINTGLATGSLEDAIQREIKELDNFSEAQIMAGGYRKVDNIFSSLYYYQLKAWFEYLPRDNFLILKSEDFYLQTPQIMVEVFNFIGINPQELPEYQKVNEGSYSTVKPEIRSKLFDYLQPYNQKLEELLDREFDWK